MDNEISAVFLVVDEHLHKQLQLQSVNLEQWGVQMTQQMAGPHWSAIQSWMTQTKQTVSIAMMGGVWDHSRIGEVIVNAFGHLPHVTPGGRMITNSGNIGRGHIGLAIAYKS